MVQNKKVGAGLALIAGLIGIGVSGTAAALPELQVGSRLQSEPDANAEAQFVESGATTVDEEYDTGVTQDNTQPASN
jgi:hypothetical protein